MIINCPNCSSRISDKHPSCPKCRVDLADSGDGLSVTEARKRYKRRLKNRLEIHGYAAVLMTVAGATWMYFSSDQMQNPPTFWPTATMATGALWYLSVRVYTIFARIRG